MWSPELSPSRRCSSGRSRTDGLVFRRTSRGIPDRQRRPADPCGSQIAECTITWKAGSDTCKAQGIASICTTLYQCAHATLDDAKKQCEKVYGVGTDAGAQSCDPCQWAHGTQGDPVEQCKKVCDKVNQDCIAHCPKGDKGCMYNCNVEYGKCLKDCKK